MKIQPELLPGESFQWAAMPNPEIVFHSDDWAMIPFSLLWGGFAIFWEAGVLGYWGNGTKAHPAPSFFALWGVPFVLIGQYAIWGRFLVDAWLKRRTYYALTDRRILILQEAWKRKLSACYLDVIPEITREGGSSGTIWLGQKPPMFGRRGTKTRGWSRFTVDSSIPVLADIDDPDSVYRLITILRDEVRRKQDKGSQTLSHPGGES